MKLEELPTKTDILELKEALDKILTLLEKRGDPGNGVKEWLTTAEVMEQFGIKSPNTLQSLKAKGLRPAKLGGKNLYNYSAVVKYITKQK
jgi:hypothetical protein